MLERWITPSVFAGTRAVNEFELSKTIEGKRRIRRHHETFITIADLEWLKAQSIELLRVPVGYWIFGDDERYVGAIERLDWLMRECERFDLKVLIDMHAAPGAQNKADHSGSGNTVSNIHSTKWLNNSFTLTKETIQSLCLLAERYRDSPCSMGLAATE